MGGEQPSNLESQLVDKALAERRQPGSSSPLGASLSHHTTGETGERREWLKEKRKESEREGRRLKDFIRLEELRMMNRALGTHAD